MNLSSVQIALRPVLNDDVSGIISKYYFRDMFRERKKLLNSLHFELLEEVQKRVSIRINVIDDMLYNINNNYDNTCISKILDDHDYFHNLLLDTEFKLFVNYGKI
jgi:hypothetical protein